jgi:hypothetical protein
MPIRLGLTQKKNPQHRAGGRGAEERPSAQLVRIPPAGPPPRCVPARALAGNTKCVSRGADTSGKKERKKKKKTKEKKTKERAERKGKECGTTPTH